jgi:glycosyltransferase involved in cell wall biosynthesis
LKRRSSIVVLHVIPAFGQGGAERLLRDLALGASEQERHLVTVMLEGGLLASGLEIHELGLPREAKVRAAWQLPRAGAALANLVVSKNVDVIQGWLYYGALLTRWVRPLNRKIIWSMHNTTFPRFHRNPKLLLADRLTARLSRNIPDQVIYCTQGARHLHEGRGYDSAKSIVIENGVNTELFTAATLNERLKVRASLGVSPADPVIGVFARNNPQKDIPGTLAAVAKVLSKKPQLRLLLVGTGMDRENSTLERELRRTGLLDRTIRLGARADVEVILRGLDLVVLGSRYGEAMPMALLEALCAGVPIAATRVGDVNTLPVPRSALTPQGDSAELAVAIEMGLAQGADHPAWRDAFAEARRRFTVDRYRREHSELYRSLMNEPIKVP